jgi:hypothetical protein
MGPILSLSGFGLAALVFWVLAPVAGYFANKYGGPAREGEAVVLAFTIATIMMCASLYELRRVFRSFYGLIELAVTVGLATTGFIAIAKHADPTVVLSPLLSQIEFLPPSLTFLAAIYGAFVPWTTLERGFQPRLSEHGTGFSRRENKDR